MEIRLKPDERMDDLQRNGLKIIQNAKAFRFGMDAVLLADFTRICPRDRVADMGTGTGILPLLLSQKEETATFDAFEIQPDMAEMAQRSVAMNDLTSRIVVHAEDMRNAPLTIGRERMDAVVCNPPYSKDGAAIKSEARGVAIARHEENGGLQEIVQACAAVLRNRGRLSMVFPAQRMLELLDSLRAFRLEPKRIRMVCAKADRAPYLIMVEAMKNARPALLWMPPLIVYHEDGSETEEIGRIYHRA